MTSFIKNTLGTLTRSAIISTLESIINNADSKAVMNSFDFLMKASKTGSDKAKYYKTLIIKIKRIVKNVQISIDEKNKILTIQILLLGDEQKTDIKFQYEKIIIDKYIKLQILDLFVSKPWMHSLVKDFIVDEGVIDSILDKPLKGLAAFLADLIL